MVNGILDKSIDRRDAHTVAILTGYGINALREATGGKMKMSVFLQDMHRNKVKIEMLSQEEMDRFLQGNEEIQIEVLKQLEDRGGIVEAEVSIKPDRQLKPKLDTQLLSNMTGIDVDKVKDVLDGKIEPPKRIEALQHEWTRDLAARTMFCLNCGIERDKLKVDDKTWACSGSWGLV